MKRLILALCAITILSCENEKPKDYVTFSGKITNKNSDSIRISSRTFKKIVAVKEDGTFSDTLKVEPGKYSFYDGGEATSVFLKNGYDLYMTLDTDMFDETIQYTGVGAENNNFLAASNLQLETLLDIDTENIDEQKLDEILDNARIKYTEFIENAVDIDTTIISDRKDYLESTLQSMQRYYGGIIALRQALPQGSPSPSFKDYENYNGGSTSLADLKGKYVYVDVWATWCAPCKAEIPYLKKLDDEFKDKNIAFVSMSIDDDKRHNGSWEKAHENWKKMVTEKELTGVQIMAPKGWESDFVKAYKINGIPRFILIDPNGNVVDPNAPRPSDPKLKEILETMI